MISVCIATYNGERYLKEQIDSILKQLGSKDEIIISDDGSTDQTISIIEGYQKNNVKIKLVEGPRQGVIANFNNAISLSKGKIIFLADQDDVWLPDKVEKIRFFFDEHPSIDLVISDLSIVNEKLEVLEPSYFRFKKVKKGLFSNIIKNNFIGAGMAFRSDLKTVALPIPSNVPMHDMWLGLIASSNSRSGFLEENLTLYRRHENNVSEIKTKANLFTMFKWRVLICWYLFKRLVLNK